MDDRQLLEDAARAAEMSGVEVKDTPILGLHVWSASLFNERGSGVWNPLTDDGDALRLAVKLCLSVEIGEEFVAAGFDKMEPMVEHVSWDRDAATRRAIVRAAAAIGRQKEAGNA